MKNIYDELRESTAVLMDNKGWTQRDLADKIEVTQQSVSTWMCSHGHVGTLSPLVLDRLVQLLRKHKLIAPKL